MKYILILVIIFFVLYSLKTQVKEYYEYHQDPTLKKLVSEITEHFPDAGKLKYHVGDESYTLNKEKVFICTKDEKTQKQYDDNVLKYVLLHEYAHSICPEVGHTELYHKIFRDVLNKAIQRGIYDPNITVPVNYCK